ncbi:MAG: HU family DNA-binding protein [Bacteroidaceae bacterium]|nr:HU family DNA-binding protein [Bacteroidaceae bacterium]
MAIQFEFYRNPNSEGTNKKRYHARVVTFGRVDTEQLAQEIHRESALSKNDVKAVLMMLADKVKEHLGEGRRVNLDGIGTFQVNLRCREEVRTPHAVRAEKVAFKSITFRATTELRNSMKNQKLHRSRIRPHSNLLTEEEIDAKLVEHFSQRETLTRHEFQFLCGQVKSTAQRNIKRLVEAGRLRNVATARNPVYVLVKNETV